MVSTQQVLVLVLRDPVGGLPAAFGTLGRQRSLEVGISFAVLGAVLVVAGVHMTIPAWVRPANTILGSIVVAAAMFAGLSGATTLARRVLHGTGSPEGDVFTATVSLAPVSVLVFIAGVIGISNIEVIGAAGVFALTWTVLMLHSGVTRIVAVPDPAGAYAVPVLLIACLWLTSIVFRAIL